MEYPKLQRGNYTFEVIAIDRDLTHSRAPATVDLEVYLSRVWVGGLAMLGVLGLLFVVQTGRVFRREHSLRKLHLDLQESHNQLERRVEERTSELEAQRSLSMRSDRLRSLGEMAAGIAHELNQPLMGVRGLAEHILIAMERGWDMPEETLRERASGIVEQSDRMVHIIRHVMMFAREAGKEERTLVQVNEVVQSALDLLGAQLQSHDIRLLPNFAERLPPVSVNRYSLEEVVLNLVNNARDAVEERYPHREDRAAHTLIEVETRLVHAPEQQDQVCVTVKDNGPGISPAIVEKVFDPFFTTKEPDKGTGLGLAISRSIIEEFGGHLRVRSDPEQGAVFTILLPAATPLTNIKHYRHRAEEQT